MGNVCLEDIKRTVVTHVEATNGLKFKSKHEQESHVEEHGKLTEAVNILERMPSQSLQGKTPRGGRPASLDKEIFDSESACLDLSVLMNILCLLE